MGTLKNMIFLCLLVFFGGCATMNSKEIPKMDNSTSVVYIIHEKVLSGDTLLKEKIFVNGQSQSKLKTNYYTFFYAKPGEYKVENEGGTLFGSDPKLAGSIEIKLEAGKVYYLSYKIKTKIIETAHINEKRISPAGAEWTILDEAKGKELIEKMTFCKPIKDNF